MCALPRAARRAALAELWSCVVLPRSAQASGTLGCAATDGVLPKYLRGGGAGTAEVGSLRQKSSGETSKRI